MRRILNYVVEMILNYFVKDYEIDESGNKLWYNDKHELHRLNGPAIEFADGSKEWWIEGKLHRSDGPAMEYINGDKWWFINGQLYRLDGPAIELANGDKSWYIENKLHRLDGPAKEYANGKKEWWYYGKYIKCSSIEEFNRLIKLMIFW